jgi:predicted outer membrane protein
MIRKLLFATAVLVAAPAFAAMPPAQFLQHAIKGDNSEMRLGRLISRHGASGQVRQFGATLTSDHSLARSQAAALARRMGVRPPTAMAPEARAEYAKLSHMRGRAFDWEVRRYMINDHRKDIAAFESQARGGDPRTAHLARMQLPTLRKHLRIAESIRG